MRISPLKLENAGAVHESQTAPRNMTHHFRFTANKTLTTRNPPAECCNLPLRKKFTYTACGLRQPSSLCTATPTISVVQWLQTMRLFYALTFKPLTLYPSNQTNSQFQVQIARKLQKPNVSHPTLRFHRMKSSAFAAKHFDALFTTFLEHGLLKFQYFTNLTPMSTLQ